MKTTVILITIIVILGIILYWFLSRGLALQFQIGRPKMQSNLSKDGVTPLGLVSILDAEKGRVSDDRTGIWAYERLYGAMGVTREKLEQWQDAHGMDSLGVDQRGLYLAPEYPVLSKVAWMFIDPVDLSHEETVNLIAECDKLIAQSDDSIAKEEFRRIRKLASTAVERSQAVRFGYP
jgi:hypothetical protein